MPHLNLNPRRFRGFIFVIYLGWRIAFAVLWCASGGCDMVGNDEDHDSCRRPGADDCGWSSTGLVLDGRMIGRSGDAVGGLHHTQGNEEREFLG
jgi:hypothetical protein